MTRSLAAALAALLVLMGAESAGAAGGLKVIQASAAFPDRAFVLTTPAGLHADPGAVTVTENGVAVRDLAVLPGNASGRFGTVFLIDTSNSMKGRPIADAIAAARAFAERRSGDIPVGLIAFNNHARTVLPLTVDSAQIKDALATVPELDEGTHIYDAVRAAAAVLSSARVSAGSIVLLSDGADTGSAATLEDAISAAKGAHIRLFSVGLRSETYEAGPLQSMASQLGGVYTEATSSAQLTQIFDALGSRLSNDVLVAYRSIGDPNEDIDVAIRVKGTADVGSISYQAPPLPTYAGGPFHRSWSERFWRSTGSALLIALLSAGLIAFSIFTLLQQPRSRMLRRRMAEFVTVSQDGDPGDGSAAAAASPWVGERMFAGAERGLARVPRWERFKETLEIAEIQMPAEQVVLWTFVGTVVAMWGLGFLFGSLIFSVLGLFVPLISRGVINWKLKKRRRAFSEQLPDNLQVLSSALRAGHSFVGALSVVVEEAGEPSKSEFRRVVADEQLGVPLEESLDDVARRMDSRELGQVALLAALQRRTGSNSAEVLDRVGETVRERFELRRLVRTLTAQGRLSRWVLSLLPAALLVIISALNPGYIHPLLHTGGGQLLLTLSTIMVVLGSLIIKKIVEIEV